LLDEKMLAQGFQNINLKVQESWGQMTTSLGAWSASLSKDISKAWSASSSYISGKWNEVGKWAKKSTDEFLAAHPKLAEAVAKFPKSFDEAGRLAKNLIGDTQAKFKAEFPKLYANLETTFKTVGSFTSGLMDSIGDKWKDAKNFIKEKLGIGDSQPATRVVPTSPAPAGTPATATTSAPVFNDADKKNIQSWADGVNAGKYGLENVPAVYRTEVAKLVKSKPAKPADKTTPKPAAAPVQGTPTTQPGSTQPTRVTLGSMPQKSALTAAEKANAMETVAGNTKYTNDLLIASQKNLENLNKIMIQKLDSIVSATEAAAGYGKKTARNTS